MTVKIDTLAINGGEPVRREPLPAPYLGTSVLGEEELALLTEVVQKRLPFRAYGDGTPHMADDFEKEAKAYFGMPFALATATGSGSFYCAMAGLGVGPGDEVIIPSFSWYTDFEAPALLGATPVFADVDRSMNMDPDDFRRKITPRTKAVIIVHYQGACGDLGSLLSVAAEHGIAVVEDCAQACGGEYKGRKLSSYGDVACFSFQQNKIMSTGDGGLMLAKDPVVFERAVRFHDLGFLRPSFKAQLGGEERESMFCGSQWRMNEFTGAVALAQLRKLDSAILDITRRHYRRIRETLLAQCPGIAFRNVGDVDGDAGIALFVDLGTPEKAVWFSKAVEAEGIRVGPSSSCANLLETPFIQQPSMAHPALPPFGKGWPDEGRTYSPDLCPNTNLNTLSMMGIAIVPGMSEMDADDVARAIAKVWHGRGG